MMSKQGSYTGLKVLLLVCGIIATWVPMSVQAQNVQPLQLKVTSKEGRAIITTDGGKTWQVVQAVGAVARRNHSAEKISVQHQGAAMMPQGSSMAYPNPVRGLLSIQYGLEQTTDVQVTLHDSHGSEVLRANEGPHATGEHVLQLDTSSLPDGVYFYRIVGGGTIIAGSTVIVVH